MIKLVAFDLDGTVIDRVNRCDSSVSEVISELRKDGIRFAVVSGRACGSVEPLLEEWGLAGQVDYLIGSNGGELLNLETRKLTSTYTLEPEVFRDILDLYEPLHIIPTYYEGSTLYVQVMNEHVKAVGKRVGVNLVQADVREKFVSPTFKEMFIVEETQMKEVEAFAAEHPDERYISFKTATDLYEMNHPLLAKDVALRKITEETGILPEEMMAFGDTSNDIKMLQYVKYGIVMANGSEDAKAIAYDIAPSVDEQGFAKYLRAHVINGVYKK